MGVGGQAKNDGCRLRGVGVYNPLEMDDIIYEQRLILTTFILIKFGDFWTTCFNSLKNIIYASVIYNHNKLKSLKVAQKHGCVGHLYF